MAKVGIRKFVRDLMQIGVETITPDLVILEIARIFQIKNLESVIVLNPEDGNAIGYIPREKLIQAFVDDNTQDLTARSIMIENIPQIAPDLPLKVTAQMMLDNHTRILYLMHHSGGITYPAAQISFNNFIQYLAANDESEMSGLGFEAQRKTPVEVFLEKRDSSRKKLIEDRERR